MKKLEDDLISDGAMHAPLHKIEQMMRTAGRELMREMMQAHFDRRSAQEREVDVRDANGVERVRIREGQRTVMAEFGEDLWAANCTKPRARRRWHSRRNMSAPIDHATLARSPTRFRASGRTSGSSSDRNSSRRDVP